jgi:hypothetical protein
MADNRKNEEAERNYFVFKKSLRALLKTNPGEFALMHQGELKGLYTTEKDAKMAGTTFFPDSLFTIQQVVPDTSPLPDEDGKKRKVVMTPMGPQEIADDAIQTPPANRPWYWNLIPPLTRQK